MTKSVLITGASSGIGEELARTMADAGYEVGMTARRLERLEEIGSDLPTRSYCARMDVTRVTEARETFDALVAEMDGVDVVVLNAGIGPGNPDLEWGPDRDTIDTNIRGFVALATKAMNHFDEQGEGHLVGMSSVASYVGIKEAPAYSASKAFVSNYLEALRFRQHERSSDVTITTIEPGYVDTDLSMGGFWEASTETAASQIHRAIRKEKRTAVITRRWNLIVFLLQVLPAPIRRRMVD